MGGAGSSQSEKVVAKSVRDLSVSTDTQNVGARYAFLDFEEEGSQLFLLVIATVTLGLTILVIYKRRCAKKKKRNDLELQRRVEVPQAPSAPPYSRWPQFQPCIVPPYSPGQDYRLARFDPTCVTYQKG